MKQKSSIFWWFGRKRIKEDKTPLFKDQEKKKQVITLPPIPTEEDKKDEINEVKNIVPNKEDTNKIKEDVKKVVSHEKQQEEKSDHKSNELKISITDREPDPLINARIEVKSSPAITTPFKEEKKEDKLETLQQDNEKSVESSTLDEIEIMLKRNWHELENIRYELNIIKEQEEKETDTKEVEILLERLEKLIKKLEEIKKDFYNKNFKEIYKSHNSDAYIMHLINEYKDAIKNDDRSNASILQIKQIEEYINIIDEIIDIEKETDKLNYTLEDKKEEYNIRDDEFEDLKDSYYDIEKEEKFITSFLKEQDYILKEIDEKVKNSTTITKTVEYKSELVINYTKLLKATLLLATANMFPPTRKGNALRAGLMVSSVFNFANVVSPRIREDKTITKVRYIDYSDVIHNQMDSLNNITSSIKQAIEIIKVLKSDFAKEFSEYAKVIPEFNNMMLKLNDIEKELIIKNDIIKDYNQRLDETLSKNNVKVKSLTEE